MAQRTPARPPVVSAAEALELELRLFERVATETLEVPLDSQKHLQKARRLLDQLCGVEDRLNEQVQGLVAAITTARERQEALAGRIQAWGQQLQARNQAFATLAEGFETLGEEVAAVTGRMREGEADPGEVLEALEAAVHRARSLEEAADEQGFKDVVRTARSRREQLVAAADKLRRATGR